MKKDQNVWDLPLVSQLAQEPLRRQGTSLTPLGRPSGPDVITQLAQRASDLLWMVERPQWTGAVLEHTESRTVIV